MIMFMLMAKYQQGLITIITIIILLKKKKSNSLSLFAGCSIKSEINQTC